MAYTLVINISKQDVLFEVGRITNYLGKKSTKEGAYDNIAAISADDAMLSDFWEDGVDAVVNELKAFKSSYTTNNDNEEGFYSCSTMSEYWDSSNYARVNSVVKKFLINYIVSRWTIMTMALEMSERYDTIANNAMSQLVEFLYSTKRPDCNFG